MQDILIFLIFILSIFFVGRRIYQEFSAKDGCAKGCGDCSIAKPHISDKAIQS